MIQIHDRLRDTVVEVEPLYVHGVWAVHPTLMGPTPAGAAFAADDFTITHIPTGSCAVRKLPSADAAESLARALPPTWAAHVGFGPVGVGAVQNRKDVQAIINVIRAARAEPAYDPG